MIEFTGPTMQYLTMADRFSMANMAIEAGAKTGLFTPDDQTRQFVQRRGDRLGEYWSSDPDADYIAEYEYRFMACFVVIDFETMCCPDGINLFDVVEQGGF